MLSRGNAGIDVLDLAAAPRPRQPRHQLRPGDVLGSGTVGTGCILELTPEAVGGWLKPGDVVELTDRAARDPAATAIVGTHP